MVGPMGLSLRQSLAAYAFFMALACAGIACFLYSSPPLPEAHCQDIVTPMDVIRGKLVKEPQKSILGLWTCLREYKKDNWWRTTIGIWLVYVLFKVFGPLGAGTSMVLSILTGALYTEWAEPYTGYSLLAHCIGVSGEVCGGSGGFIMSSCVGREILLHFAPVKMKTLKGEMDKFRAKGLFRYMMFLRITPLFPNWFVNYSVALIGMPFSYFFVASILAIQPAATMSIAMGGMLRDVGEKGLDLVAMSKRGGMMAVTMFLFSLPLVPAEDWRKGINRFKRMVGMKVVEDKDKAKKSKTYFAGKASKGSKGKAGKQS